VKLADYIASFLASQGVTHVFVFSGGASLHLIQGIANTTGMTFICPQHEQAGAMSADAYARVTGNLGAAIATSGPGATNLLTGVCCAYYDSVPVMFITGQVATYRLKGNTGVRQFGFQETAVTDIFQSVTKYVTMIKDPRQIRYELEKAAYLARSGRPGPVLIDVPDDVQRMEINPEDLPRFVPDPIVGADSKIRYSVETCVRLLKEAERPVLIVGWGVRLSKAEKEAHRLFQRLGFPILPTWAVRDMLSASHPLLVGAFGTHGTRYGNFAVQNADFVLSVGARLDTKAAGTPLSSFARGAKKVIVDIDASELAKFEAFGMKPDLVIHADAREFLTLLNNALTGIEAKDISAWWGQIKKWQERYPICPQAYDEQESVNPYSFVKALSARLVENQCIFVDTGCAVAWMLQAFDFKAGQRLFHDFNNTAMGYALPGSIGACFGLGRRPVVCVTGDGSLQMNIQELATVIRHELPIKIFLLNNHGHSMIQQTQDQWLESRYLASSVEGGLAFPDFLQVAKAYGFPTINVTKNADLARAIAEALSTDGPVFCNVEIGAAERVSPQVVYGRPIEDMGPLLDRKEFSENMLVAPVPESLR